MSILDFGGPHRWSTLLTVLTTILGLLLGLYFVEDHPQEPSKVMEGAKIIGGNLIKNVRTQEMVMVETLWADSPVVISFLRRFGCVFCRQGAKEMSKIVPQLSENGVRLIGIGLEELGVEDFVKGSYFDGELYVDSGKKCFSDLGFSRYSTFSMFTSFLSPSLWSQKSKAENEEKLSGNLEGDGFQNGGAIVVAKGGKVLYQWNQPSYREHAPNSEILKSLGINA